MGLYFRSKNVKSWFKTFATSFLLAIVLPAGDGRCAFEPRLSGSRYIAAGYTGIASAQTLFPVLSNPAKLAAVRRFGLDADYQDYYGLKSVRLLALDIHGRFFRRSWGIGITEFGNNLYCEREFQFGFAQQTGGFSTGITVSACNLEIARYGSATEWGVSVGGLYNVSNALSGAFIFRNFNRAAIGASGERIPGSLMFGLEYMPVEGVYLRGEISKTDEMPFDYRYGMEYILSKQCIVMCGYREQAGSVCLGASFLFRRLQIGYALEYHMVLGGKNCVSMHYDF